MIPFPKVLLDGPLRKVERAQAHMDAYKEVLGEWVKTDPVIMVIEGDSDVGYHIFRAYFRSQPPPKTGLILGDAVHNLRSALDHLAQLLVLQNRASPHSRTCFPILLEAGDFWGKRKGRYDPLRGIAPEWQEEIARWQSFAMYPDAPRNDPLAIITRLDNMDKHRNLILAAGCVALHEGLAMDARYQRPATININIRREPAFEDGTIILHVAIDPPGFLHVDVDPQTLFAMKVGVDVWGDGPIPLPDFTRIYEVFEAFSPAF